MNGESLMKILALEFSSAQRSVAVLSSPEKGGDTPDALEPARPQAGPCPSGSGVEGIETGLGGTRGLALVNFRREPVYLPDESLEQEPRFRRYAIGCRKLADL